MPSRPQGPGADKSSGMGISVGVFAREVEIARVENFSNHPTRDPFEFESGFAPQLCLKVHYTDGDYDGSLMVFGKYEKDESKKIVEWNENFNGVQRFLHFAHPSIEYKEDDFSISEKTLEAYAGQRIIIVKYQSNKEYFNERKGAEDFRMQSWNKVFKIGTDIAEIKKEWEDNLEWVKDYAPDIWEEKQSKRTAKNDESTSFPHGANEPKKDMDKPETEDII